MEGANCLAPRIDQLGQLGLHGNVCTTGGSELMQDRPGHMEGLQQVGDLDCLIAESRRSPSI